MTVHDIFVQAGVVIKKVFGDEFTIDCPFNSCDKDSRANEGHCYVNNAKEVFHCKKCDAKGHFSELAKALGIAFDTQRVTAKKSRWPSFNADFVDKAVQNLNGEVLEYLKGRGLTEKGLSEAKVGFQKLHNGDYITFPYFDQEDRPLFVKLRRFPEDKKENRFMIHPKGVSMTSLYMQAQLYKPDLEEIFIAEGETDTLTLASKGYPAVGLPNGAKKLPEEVLHLFGHLKRVYICMDNDTAGKMATSTLGDQLAEEHEAMKIFFIDWQSHAKECNDVNELYQKREVGSLHTLFSEYRTKGFKRCPQLTPLKRQVGFTQWYQIVSTELPDLKNHVMTCASAFAQLLIKDVDNPFGLILSGPASSGKTTCLRVFQGATELAHVTDRVTSASFVSNSAQLTTEELEKVDLLPKIQNKVLIINDLASWFTMKDDDLADTLGKFTRLMDGHGLSTDTGTHGHRGYTGQILFMVLGATVSIPNKVRRSMGNLGARLFMLQMPDAKKATDEELRLTLRGNFGEGQKKLQSLTRDFLLGLWHKNPEGIEWAYEQDPPEIIDAILVLARFLTIIRAVREQNEKAPNGLESSEEQAKFMVEDPKRAARLLFNLARGLAVLRGERQLEASALPYLTKVVFDSGNINRAKVLFLLIQKKGVLTTGSIKEHLGLSEPTAIKNLKELQELQVGTLTKVSGGSWSFQLDKNEYGKALELFDLIAGRKHLKLSTPSE